MSRNNWKKCYNGAKRQDPKSVQTRHKKKEKKKQEKKSSRTGDQGSPATEKLQNAWTALDSSGSTSKECSCTRRRSNQQNSDKKGLSVLRAMAAKSIEESNLYLLYKWYSSSLTVGLTTLSHSNLLKLDRVQNEATRVILGTTQDIPI